MCCRNSKVLETNIPYQYQDKKLTITALMKIRLLKRYPPEPFTIKILKSEYRIFAVRGPRGVPRSPGARHLLRINLSLMIGGSPPNLIQSIIHPIQ